MFCTYCGKNLTENEVFCPQCGKEVGTDTEEARLKQEEETESPASTSKSCGAKKAKYGFAKTLIITTVSATVAFFTYSIISDFNSGALLYYAAKTDNANRIHRLIAMGQDVNVKFYDGNTALIGAVQRSIYNSYDAVELLIESGADVNAKDNHGRTALIHAAYYDNAYITDLIIDSGADVNAKDYSGRTALMEVAVSRRHWNCVSIAEQLIESGADVNAKDNSGETALMKVAKSGYWGDGADNTVPIDFVKLLIKSGADVNAKDNDGKTALMHAAEQSEHWNGVDNTEPIDFVKLLIKSGANINAKDNDGKTALTIAKSKGTGDLVRALQDAGAR